MKRLYLLGIVFLLALFTVVSAKPVQAQTAVWTSQFFNNIYFLGTPVHTRQDTQLIFNWGFGSPHPNVPSDYFSARFTADVYFVAGQYRFSMIADDGGRVLVNGIQVINTLDNLRPNQLITGDFTFPISGFYRIQADYVEITGTASFTLTWQTTSGIPAPTPTPGVATGVWTGTFYNTHDLSGPAVAVITDTNINRNWGLEAPLPGVNADNFSIRWVSTQYLPAGQYLIDVHANDGIRVYIDGQMVINEWHVYLGERYSHTFNVPFARNYELTVEYQEGIEEAFLEFNLTRTDGRPIVAPTPTIPTTSPTGLYAIVTTSRLNVRDLPTAIGSRVLTRISGGETYVLLAYSQDNNWAQLNVNGILGWVNVRYINITNTPSVQSPTGVIATTTTALNMRIGPDVNFARIVVVPAFISLPVIGRNASSTWWQVTYNGQTGWVSAQYAPVPASTNINVIPITG